MKTTVILAILLGSMSLVQADDTIAKAQQALKDQGFYYGQITGEKDTDTTAAIRRYQIRNGLQVSGELDKETLDALVSGAPVSAQPAIKNTPLPRPASPNESPRENENPEEIAPQPYALEPRDNSVDRAPPQPFFPRQQPPPESVVPPGGGLFTGTPYEMSPPEVQRNIVASAQEILARKDLYRGDIDGIFGPGTEFSIRAYQARLGLAVTGRLDLETLAGLNLLPGRRTPMFRPRPRIVRPFRDEPVRGEWIPED